jgi:Family of unknown function (DUF6328)
MADEDHRQRVNRELGELLNELRVALPGVQVLFGFLLTVPFQARFTVTAVERDEYYVTLLACALSVVLLVAPAAQHRLLFRKRDKELMLLRFNQYAIAGLLCLGLALSGALLLVTSYLFGAGGAAAAVTVTVILILWLWIVRPLLRRRSEADDV